MFYLLAFVAAILTLDIIRSVFGIRKAAKAFLNHYMHKKQQTVETIGSGKPFHLAIMGDSTFDVRGDTALPYGPAQMFVNELARLYTVHVHLLAKAGAKSYDVTAQQLPKLSQLAKVDMVVVYMGANDTLYLKSPFRVKREYQKLLSFTEARAIPVAASQLGNYWQFGLFPWIQRAWMYLTVHIENAGIRRAFAGTKYASLFVLKQAHNDLHNNRRSEPYLLDGIHPNDDANRMLGTRMLEYSRRHPAIAALFQK